MSIEHEKRHKHDAKSSQAFLTSEKIIDAIGLQKGEETPGPPQEIRIAIREGTKIMFQYGFECQKTYSPGPYHYGLIFVKSSK